MKDVKLINQNFLEKKLKESKEPVQDNSQIFLKWHNDNRKEEAIQSDFLNDIFGKILGYEIETDKEYNLDKEYKTQKDGTKVDGVLGFFTKEIKNVKAVVELKGKNTKNLDEVEKQAFEYRDKIDGIEFVITSNTEEIRLYSAKSGGRLKYQSWTMLELSNSIQKQKEFYFLLCKQNLIGIDKHAISNTKKLIEEDIKREDEIKAKFYKEYKALREEFVKDILKQNTISNGDAISKTQKLLDRLLFIRFCEDNNFITKPFEKVDFAKQLGFQLWDSMKQLFIAIDKGNPPHIHKFNGGLFATDEFFDSLKISTNLLEKLIGFLRLYHFKNDISVHILGHIFEQSITDLEALKAGLVEENFDKKQGKRKKDGIFYTPEYITKYIVEEAVGGWLNDRKNEFEIEKHEPKEIPQIKPKKWVNPNQELINKYKQYAEKLKQIKVLDPACGSGAFLVEVFHYLENEWLTLSETLKKLGDEYEVGLFSYSQIYKSILQNNIYGVDLNQESVQITKLSLWLKTANLNDELTTLDNNIKCGNSLIDDHEIAGEKAFKWEEEFPFKFDVVVGNPPYVIVEGESVQNKEFKEKYELSQGGKTNLYKIFIEKAYKLLVKNGNFGFITPSNYLTSKDSYFTRKLLIEKCKIIDIFEYPESDNVFENVTQAVATLVCKKEQTVNAEFAYKTKTTEAILKYEDILKDKDLKIKLPNDLISKIQLQSNKLSDFADGFQGEINVSTKKEHFTNKADINLLKLIRGNQISRYLLINNEEYCPVSISNRTHFNLERIVFQEVSNNAIERRVNATIENNILCGHTTNYLLPKNELSIYFLLAFFNSKLINWYFKQFNMTNHVAIGEIKTIPVPNLLEIDQQPFITHAQKMLDLTRELNEKRNGFIDYFRGKFALQKITRNLENWHTLEFADFIKELSKQKVSLSSTDEFDFKPLFDREKKACMKLQSQITKTDAEIDKMVYALYGLSEEEVRVVENLVV